MPPVSDPQNWNWTTWSFAPMIGFAMHNTAYRVTVQWRYGVYMKGPRGPFQTSITINVQNLSVNSPDVGKVLRWDPEKGIADKSFSYNIECAQKKQVQVKVRIYDMNRNLVYELTEQKICPGSYSFTWDGTVNTGYYEYPPDEWSNIAPAGLYTFDVEVIANPYDRDAVRSQALTVVPGPVEYLGYDDGGTPEDESDDNYLYYLRWYALYSGRDASYGEIWLYDPDLERVQSWIVPVLQCVVHENCDGLTANPNGETHGVIIPVPVSLMEKAGTYTFVLHFYDDYADTYKNHQVKAALEVNQQAPEPALHIWVGQNIARKLIGYQDVIQQVNNAFNRIGVTIIWHWGPNGLGYSMKKEEYGNRLNLPSDVVEEANRSFRGVHVLLEDWPQGMVDKSLPPGFRWYGTTIRPMIGSKYQYSPRNAATTYIRFDELFEATKHNGVLAFKWALANVLIHEFTHAASRGRVDHCENHSLQCIMYPNLSDFHQRWIDHGFALYTTRSPIDRLLGRTRTYIVPLEPWHSTDEVFAIREGIGLNRLDRNWLQQR
jgi:hypothetical protein